MTRIEADQAVPFKAPSLKFTLTPEERQILKITDEDIASFADEDILLTPAEIEAAITDMIATAYDESSVFKQLVDADVAQDPKRLGRSAKVVSKFLKHLRGILPSDKVIAIKTDTFDQAHDMVRKVLHDKIKRLEPPMAVPEHKIAPITDSDLELFGVTRDKLTASSTWESVKNSVLFFLNKLRGSDGKTIKNKATAKMPDDLKIKVLSGFLNEIRNKKLEIGGGKLSASDERWLGRTTGELQKIARALVVPAARKEDTEYTNDLIEVIRQSGEVVSQINSISEIFKDKKTTDVIQSHMDFIDHALPSVLLFEDRIKSIQEEIDKLGLNDFQRSVLTEVDYVTLAYTDPIKTVLEDKNIALSGINKEIEKNGLTPDLASKKSVIEDQIQQLKNLLNKDTSALKKAIDEYLNTLRTFKKNIADHKIEEDQVIVDLIRMIDAMALNFSRLAKEQLFKARWSGKSGFLFRKEKSADVFADAGVPASVDITKEAAGVSGYADKVERFRDKGFWEAYKEIQYIIESDDKLPMIKEKLLSIMEVKPGTKWDDSGTDYSGNPLGGKGISLDDAEKIISRLRGLIKKININEKSKEVLEILQWAAILQNHIKGEKYRARAKKMADAAFALRKLAKIVLGEEPYHPKTMEGKPDRYQSPSGAGRGDVHKEPGRAGWIIFRERLTKMGKKALQSFFEEPTFVPDFVEEMEKAGLNIMLLHGGKVEAKDIEPVLENIIQKSTGKKGDLANILTNEVMQRYRAEHDIKKVEKELKEVRNRVDDINDKINETEKKYIPKLRQFAEFIKDPIGMAREQIKSLIGKKKEKVEKVHEDIGEVIKAERVNVANYQSLLQRLLSKYLSKEVVEVPEEHKTPAENKIRHYYPETVGGPGKIKMAFLETSKLLPRDFMKQYQVWKKNLKDIKAAVDREENETKRASRLKDYYNLVITFSKKLVDYFEYQGKMLDADKETISRIEEFLKSDSANNERPDQIKKAEELLGKLKEAYDVERKKFDDLKKHHSDIQSVGDIAKDKYDTIISDLEDGKVEMLYQVAISPELYPDKETAREIKERAKEHEKGLSFIIDRNTYKNNMNRLITYKMHNEPFKITSDGKPVVLPPERKKDIETTLKTIEDRKKDMVADAEFGMKEIALKKMIMDLDRIKKAIEDGFKMINAYTELLQNIEYLESHKSEMDPKEYSREMAKLNSFMEGKGIDKKEAKRDIDIERQYIAKMEEYVKSIERDIINFKKELEISRPPINVQREIKKLLDELYRLRGVEQHRALKSMSIQEQISLLEDKEKHLAEMDKIKFDIVPGSSDEHAFKGFRKELEHQIQLTGQDLKRLKAQVGKPGQKGPMEVQALSDDDFDKLSPYEKALETRGIKPAPYMEELKKPKGWEIVEEFFNNVKREHSLLKSRLEKGLVSTLRSDFIKKRLNQLENMAKAIDGYKKQLMTIGGDQVAFKDIMMEFEDTLDEYEQILRKYINQRDDAINRLEQLKQERDHLANLFDPATGEFKGLSPEEVNNIKGIFLRMLYRDLESYWATKVGKDLSIFGERGTEWYNNVYRTFKNLAGTRSNRKMLSMINKYKQETRSDFDDLVNRLKSEELEKRLETLKERYKELGGDPDKSEAISTLETQIDTLKNQEKQINKVFREMAAASLAQLDADIAKSLAEEAEKASVTEEDKPVSRKPIDKIEKQVEIGIDKAVDEFERELDTIIAIQKSTEQVDRVLKAGERKLNITSETSGTPAATEKKAYDKNHPDFNLNILYSKHIQSKIVEMI